MLAEVIRSGFAESRHRGSLLVLGADGVPLLRAGQVTQPIFPRSANKPLQAAALLRAGLDLDGKLLALAAASHSGEDFHVAGVREILARAGLTERALRCPPALPMDEQVQREVLRRGGGPDRVHMNCSGKHAAMLACCVAAGWPVDSYLDPAHPVQAAIRRTLEELSGEPIQAVGVDGCGAPLFALSLTGVARALQVLVTAPAGTAARRVADAMRAHPGWTSGSRRPERALMAAVPGLLVKSGAEGVEGLALADGRAAAFKLDDGASRARPPVTVALLHWLGVAGGPGMAAALDQAAHVPVLGGEQEVGVVRATLPTPAAAHRGGGSTAAGR
ncbi:MAG TPA: asparaginase [Streptosporangiaceae bacterium]|nr:asparaginase [Streptosporangiaceae bacterium]